MRLSFARHPERDPRARRLALAACAATLLCASLLPAAELPSAPLAAASQRLQPQVDLFAKRPYLIYPGDPTRMQVLWQLTATATSTVQWGLDPSYSSGSAQTVENGNSHQHEMTIGGLTPGQRYLYRVTVQDVSYEGSFTAAPEPSATRVQFLVYGDTRTNASTHDQVAAGMESAWNSDPAYRSFVLAVGDYTSDGQTERAWTDEFFNPARTNIRQLLAQIPYQATMGNHEGDGHLFVKYFPYPFVGGRYWSFDYGPAHVVIVDQYSNYAPGSAQLKWIEKDLASTIQPWKFICLHEPGWSAGGGHSNSTAVQNYLQPLCVRYGVSVVFGGHNHYYAHAIVQGVHHITTGGGGAPLTSPDRSYPNVVAATSANHFCAVEIDGPQLSFRALRPNGTLIDSFNMVLQPTSVLLSDLAATAGSDYVDLHWSAALDGPATLQVLRSTQTDAGFAPVSTLLYGTQGRQDFAWRDASVAVATEYYYRIGWRETTDWHYSESIRVMTAAPKFGLQSITPSLGPGPSRIDFTLAHVGHARLDIFDVSGKRLCTLVDEDLGPGTRAVTWDGTARDGRPFPAGIYFAKLSSNGAVSTRKFVRVR